MAFDVATIQRKNAFALPAGSASVTDIRTLGNYISLSPDGTQLAIVWWGGERQPRIERWGVDGKPYGEFPVGSGLVQCVKWTQDGRILFAKSDDGAKWRILRLSADGAPPAFTGLEVTNLTYFDLGPDGSRIAFDGTAYALGPAHTPSATR